MSLYQCEECNCVENTALSDYWVRGDGKKLCSECDPNINKWHGMFKKKSAKGMFIDTRGFLWDEKPDHVEIVGKVTT